jgi:uncharacterized protein (DUF302 family)
MRYYISRTLLKPFDEVLGDVKTALAARGFGVLTDIDVAATLKAKLGADMNSYRILGACNPTYAYEALQREPMIGTMLPCNVIVREEAPGHVEVAAINPVASMQATDNAELVAVAREVEARLKEVLASL